MMVLTFYKGLLETSAHSFHAAKLTLQLVECQDDVWWEKLMEAGLVESMCKGIRSPLNSLKNDSNITSFSFQHGIHM